MVCPLLTTEGLPPLIFLIILHFLRQLFSLNTRSLNISGMFCFIKTMQTEKSDLEHEYQSQCSLSKLFKNIFKIFSFKVIFDLKCSNNFQHMTSGFIDLAGCFDNYGITTEMNIGEYMTSDYLLLFSKILRTQNFHASIYLIIIVSHLVYGSMLFGRVFYLFCCLSRRSKSVW